MTLLEKVSKIKCKDKEYTFKLYSFEQQTDLYSLGKLPKQPLCLYPNILKRMENIVTIYCMLPAPMI